MDPMRFVYFAAYDGVFLEGLLIAMSGPGGIAKCFPESVSSSDCRFLLKSFFLGGGFVQEFVHGVGSGH